VISSAIGIVFTDDQQHVLLIKRCDVPVWVFPGGGIEEGESPEEAVVREVKEETGLSVAVSRKIGEYTPLNCLSNYTHVFECKILNGELSTGEETRNLGFYPLSETPYPFLHVHQYWLDDALVYSPELIRKPVEGTSWFQFCKFLLSHPFLMGRYLLSRVGLTINSEPER
jgi:8-oxo-dGTP diphosphatase